MPRIFFHQNVYDTSGHSNSLKMFESSRRGIYMFQTYEEALKWIHSRLTFGIKPGLQRMEWMMEKLDHPERRCRFIHVAGTNGKGSTIAFMQEVLKAAEYKVGAFTSPYLESFNERITIDGNPISEEEILQLSNVIKPVVDELEKTELGAPTEFEVITAMMFYYFGKINVPDVVLLETGLGGKWDSTNIANPILSVITMIGHDHLNILGSTIEEIAEQKAGIIKNGVPVITAVEQKEALDVIERVAKEKKAKHYWLTRDFHAGDFDEFFVQTPFKRYNSLSLQMKGNHQAINAALSVMTLDYLRVYYSFIIEEEHIQEGLKRTFWKGRFEEVKEKPRVILDGAHNPEGMAALKETVQKFYPDKKIIMLFSCVKDKQYKEMIEQAAQIANRIIFTTFHFPKAADAKELYEACDMKDKEYEDNWELAYEKIINTMDDETVLIITGSLYFIGEVRKHIKHSS